MNALNPGSRTTLTITFLRILDLAVLHVPLNLSKEEDITLLLQANTNDINVVRVAIGLEMVLTLKKKVQLNW
jgi:hypothetical protein